MSMHCSLWGVEINNTGPLGHWGSHVDFHSPSRHLDSGAPSWGAFGWGLPQKLLFRSLFLEKEWDFDNNFYIFLLNTQYFLTLAHTFSSTLSCPFSTKLQACFLWGGHLRSETMPHVCTDPSDPFVVLFHEEKREQWGVGASSDFACCLTRSQKGIEKGLTIITLIWGSCFNLKLWYQAL